MVGLFSKKIKEFKDFRKSDAFSEKNAEEIATNFFLGIKRSQWFFSAALVFTGFFGWVLLYLGLYSNIGGIRIWAYIVLSLFVFSTGVGLSYYLLHPRRFAIFTYFLISLGAFAIFGWRGIEGFAIIVFFLATLWGYIWVKREQSIVIPLLFSRFLRRGLPIFFTGLAFTFAVFFNTSPLGQSLGGTPHVPRQFIDAFLTPLEYSVKIAAVPEFSKSLKISDFDNLSVIGVPGFFRVPPEAVKSSISDILSRLPEEAQEQTISEFFYTTINAQLSAILAPYQKFLSFVFLFGLFLVFRTIGVPIMWLSIGTGWVISKILSHFKILRARKIMVEKEELVL